MIAMVKNQTAFQLLHFIHQQPSWFKGNSLHKLYVIDLNHLLARAHANNISNRQLRNWLEGIVRNSEIAHRVIFFSSRNRCPPADFNQFNGNWQYEDNYKDPENQKLMDVDTYIVNWLTIYLFQYSQEISGIYLFSGDKDLYHVIKTANAFKIPVIIVVISHEDCALEIRTLAKSVLELESWFYER